MTERKDYVIDTSKIKTLKDVRNIFECLGIICDISILEENDPRYELAKEYFVIPYVEEPRKSLEEHSQELNTKIDKLIEDTKTKFYGSKIYADSKYEKKFDKIFDNFEYAKKTGAFPQYLSVATSGDANSYLVMGNSGVEWMTSWFNLNASENSVGYYYIEPSLKLYMNKTPNMIVRFFMNKLLNFRWIGVK